MKNWKEKIGEDGRHLVYSQRTGKSYLIEPIKPGEKYQANWGDEDPVSKKITGNYGVKYNGALTEKESVITEENGFKNIQMVEGSPYWAIEQLDKQYPSLDKD